MIPNWKSRSVESALAVLIVALGLRLGWALLIPVAPISDGVAYDTFANNLATHGVYGWTPDQPSSFWPVGTAALYAVLYMLFGHTLIPVVGFNIVLSTIIVGQTMWLTRRFFDDETAIVAGFLLAIWPSQVAYVTILASELPFTFFVLLGFSAWYGPGLSNWARAAGSGVAFAAASYVRPIALLLPIVLWLTALRDFQRLRAQFPLMLVAMIVMVACIAPWSIRNTALYGHFVLLSSNGGEVLWEGNHASSDQVAPGSSTGNEYERDHQSGEAALRYIMDHPLSFVLRTAEKAILLHLNETIAVHWNAKGITERLGEGALLPLKIVTQAYWSLMLLFALAGIVALIRKDGLISTFMHPVIATWIYFTAVYSVMLVQDRYHFPTHPFIAMLSAVAMLTAVKNKQWRTIRVSR